MVNNGVIFVEASTQLLRRTCLFTSMDLLPQKQELAFAAAAILALVASATRAVVGADGVDTVAARRRSAIVLELKVATLVYVCKTTLATAIEGTEQLP